MTPLSSLVDPTLVERLGWTLVHSTWQGAIIAAVTAVLLYTLRAARPQLRYLLACVSLASMVGTALVTFTVIRPSQRGAATLATSADAGLGRTSTQWTLLETQTGSRAMAGGVSATPVAGTPVAARLSGASDRVTGRATTRATDRAMDRSTDRAAVASRAGANGLTAGVFDPGAWRRAALMIERLLPQFVALWIAGLVICSIRLLGALALVEHLKRHQTHPMPREWQQRVVELARRMRVRGAHAIRVRASIEARTAAVIGWLRPVILVPASALSGLTTQQLEAVLAHELAHIRRHDYLVNLLQSLAETLFFYHPAVWYLSRAIRTEREHCCDDEAVAVVGDAVAYAGALTDLELLRQGTPALAMAANGGSLLRRIQRLLAPSTDTAPSWSTATSLLGLAVAIFAIASARGSIAASLQTASTPAPAATASTSGDSRTPRAAATPAAQDRRAPARTDGYWDVQPPAPPAPPARPAIPAPTATPAVPPSPRDAMQPPQPPQPAQPSQPAQPPHPIEREDDLPVPPAAPAPPAVFAAPAIAPHPAPYVPMLPPPAPAAAPAPAAPYAPVAAPAPPATPMARVYAAAGPMPPAAPAPAPHPMPLTPMLTPPAAAPVQAAPPPPPPPAPQVGGLERAKRWIESWFDDDGSNWTWQENGHRIQLRSRGQFDITDDDLDIKSVTPGGYITLEERINGLTSRVEVRSVDGHLQRAFFRDGKGVAWEPEGRAWLAKKIPDLVRRTGFGAEGRVRRILARGGPAAVLDEVTIIPSAYVKRLYMERLLTETTLQGPMLTRLLTQAGKEITSDYERATLLIRVVKSGQIATDEQRLAYALATHTINSSYEHRRALEPFVQSGPLSDVVLKTVLDSASRIESDYELASLLIPLGKTQTLTPGSTDAYILAAQTIDSDYELRRALTPLVTQSAQVPPAALTTVFRSAAGIDSDYELATLLVELVNRQKVDESNKTAFFTAVDTIQSDYERGRVLKTIAGRGPIGDALTLGVIESTHRMNSAHEAGNVLKSVATHQPLDGPLRKAFITAAERLQSSHERDTVLVMLVRNEIRAK